MANFKYTQSSVFRPNSCPQWRLIKGCNEEEASPSLSAPAGKGDCTDVHFPFGRNGPQH